MSRSVATPSQTRDAVLADLLDRLTADLKAGQCPDLDVLVRDHPELADELRQLYPAARMMTDLSRSGEPGASAPGGPAEPLGDLGDYSLIREVGRGGMGVVYEAEQRSLRRRVALKVLPWAAAMDPKQLQRFKNEALAAASLRHDHIVQVHAVGCERGVHYYAMEFIEGQTLAQVIDGMRPGGGPASPEMTQDYAAGGESPTPPVAVLTTERTAPRGREFHRRAAELIADAADALEHAHALGIVHRDVKPGNLLVDAAGKVYVSDFGLARFGPDAGLTMSGDLLGTLRYMAPEQAMARHGLADHRVDVYGLGCTLYELLTGRPAVRGDDRAEILKHIAFEEPIALRKLDRAVPAELETVALKCLTKSPNERYPTAGELAADLRRWLDDKPIRAKPPTTWQFAVRRLRRHPRTAAAVVVALLLMAVGASASAALIYREKRQTEAAYDQVREALTRADNQQRLARKAVDKLSSELVYDWFLRQTTLTPERKEFLRQTGELYRQFMEEAGDTEVARADVAGAYLQFGIMQRHLRQVAEAEAALTRAREVFELLAADFPDQIDHRVHLASSLLELGNVLAAQNRNAEGIQSYSRAVDLLEQLVAADLPNPNHRYRLAEVYRQLGLRSPHAQREAHFRKALGILEGLTREDPQPRYRRELGVVNVNLGQRMLSSGRTAEARGFLRQGVDVLEKLYLADPRNATVTADMAWSYAQLGIVASREGKLEEAAKFLAAAVTWRVRVTDNHPGLKRDRQGVPTALLLLGQVQVRMDRSAAAEKTFRKMIDAMDKLAADGPLSNSMRDHHAGSHNRLGSVLAATGRLAEAEQSCRRGLDLAERLDTEVPDVGSHVDEHATGRVALGTALYYLGRQDEAAVHFRRAVPLRERLLGIGRKDFEARHHRRLADLLSDCPDPAVRNPARAIAVARRAVEVEPTDGDNQQSLGMAQYRAGDWPAAAEALTRAIELRPGKAIDRLFLSMARWRLGETDRARKQYQDAVEWMAKHWPDDPDLRRLQAEAADLLGIDAATAGPPQGPAKKP